MSSLRPTVVLDPTDLDTRFVNEVDHDKTAHDALGLSHDSLVDASIDDHHDEAHAVASHSDATLTGAQLEDLLMFGVANAAWVPMVYEVNYTSAVLVRGESSQLTNVGNVDGYWVFNLAQPPVKGSLKLQISGLRIVVLDADADDYVTHAYLTGVGDTNNVILNDGTDRTSPDTYDYTFTAEDMSAAHTVRAVIQTVNTNAAGLNLGTVSARCYYTT